MRRYLQKSPLFSHRAKSGSQGRLPPPELAEYLGCCVPTAQKKVKRLLELGIIEKARVRITDLADRETSTFGFRYIGEQKYSVDN